jgi:RNA polymerase sigma factor (sigma-70 family)
MPISDLALLQEARGGNEAARDTLLQRYERMVGKAAHRARRNPTSLDVEDLQQHGRLGLLKAINQYDMNRRGTPFAYIAAVWINREIGHALDNENETIRIPVQARHSRKVQPIEVVGYDGVEYSVEAPRFEPIIIDREYLLALLRENLTDTEQEVIKLHFWGELPIVGVAAKLGLRPSTCDWIYNRAIAKLREAVGVDGDDVE